MRQSRHLSLQKGYLALLAVLIIMVIGFLGSTISYIFTDITSATLNSYLADKAYFVAQAGAEQATRYVLQKGVACASITGHADLTNASFGGGTFTVTGTSSVISTTLNGAITASDSSITLTSSSGFASAGVIAIDSEVMSYSSISGNTLQGVSRGMFSTTAASHATGAAIAQNQCALDATAGVPSLSSSIAKNEILKLVPLFTSLGAVSGWTVGEATAGIYSAASWDGSSWTATTLTGTGNPAAAYGLYVIAANNVWLVGDKGNFYNWNGSSWVYYNVTATNAFYGVSCGSTTDCHAVGDRVNSNTPALYDWNGSAWTRNTGATNANGTNLKSVSCTSASNCWGVGDNSNGAIFYRWNGSGWAGSTVILLAFPYKGVFCNSASDCWAVGANNIFARYDGISWSNYITTLPSAQYNGIYCNSTTDCWAVGNVNSSRDLIVRWNGTSWSRDSSNPTPVANLNAVSCISPTNCWAVGKASSGGNAVFVQYNGSTWATVTVPGMIVSDGLYALAFGAGGGITIPSNSSVVIQKLA